MDLFGILSVSNLPVDWSFSTGLKMYVVESRGGAIACMLLSLFLLGTWPALLTLLERRGRLPQHTYLDYTITNFLAAVIIAFTFGEIGESTAENPNFLIQLFQVNWPSVLFAIAGGVVLSLGNLSTQYAWAIVGLSVTNVIAASITVVVGTTLNYFLDDKINNAEILFPGVGCFLIAVCLASGVHASNAADNEAKLKTLANRMIEEIGDLQVPLFEETCLISVGRDKENVFGMTEKAKVGTADFLLEIESRRAIKIGTEEVGRHWLDFFVALETVSNLWEAKLLDMQQQMPSRLFHLYAHFGGLYFLESTEGHQEKPIYCLVACC
ncbi:ureide permease 2-like isoform X6 [Apium graveolens]|uniref:ureide permease 2-like isoform X6 n=1 Tax=Apium graveolens TaxID=4045 RepID=UPI003D799303